MTAPAPNRRASGTAPSRLAARRVAALLAALLVGTGLAWISAAPAQATSYRYWTYWSGDSGSWAFSSIGAARRPPNGGVEGWRFEVSQASSSSQPPRTGASFASICGDTQPGAGKKRVALVIDYGTAADAPPGEHAPAGVVATCVEIDAAATGYDVLASQASIRASSGLVCGIGGYPATGCGDAAADPTPSASPTHTSSGGQPSAGSGTSATGSSATKNGSGSTTSGGAKDPAPGDGPDQAGQRTQSMSATPTAPTDDASSPATDAATPVAATSSDAATGGSPVGALVGVAVIAVLGGGAWWVTRRRRTP
jgi:hypothetical protein